MCACCAVGATGPSVGYGALVAGATGPAVGGGAALTGAPGPTDGAGTAGHGTAGPIVGCGTGADPLDEEEAVEVDAPGSAAIGHTGSTAPVVGVTGAGPSQVVGAGGTCAAAGPKIGSPRAAFTAAFHAALGLHWPCPQVGVFATP